MEATAVSAHEYLHTSYEDGDREYLDGAVVERNIGELPHSSLLHILTVHLASHETRLDAETLPTCRLRITDSRYRVPDVLLMLGQSRHNGLAVLDPPLSGGRDPVVPRLHAGHASAVHRIRADRGAACRRNGP